jgi:hypothetical protein
MFIIDPIASLIVVAGVFIYFACKGVGEKLSASGRSDREALELIFGKSPETKSIPDVPVAVRFSNDNSCYLAGNGTSDMTVIRRFSSNNTIYDFYSTADGFRSTIRNQRMGHSDVVKAETAEEMHDKIEKRFREWTADDPGTRYSYLKV